MRLSFSVDQIKKAKENMGGKYLPFEGSFTVRIATIEIKPTNAGNQMMEIGVEGFGEWAGKVGTERIGLDANEISVSKGIHFMKALGFSEAEISEGLDTPQMIGRTAKLVRKDPVRESNKITGKEYTNWKTNWFALPQEAAPSFDSPADIDLPQASEPAPF